MHSTRAVHVSSMLASVWKSQKTIARAVLLTTCVAFPCAGQVIPDNVHVNADPASALIEGRVRLPNGMSAEMNVRIVLSNGSSTLNTLYTNHHGEFRFPDLKEGVYYIQAVGNADIYDPVTEKLYIARGQVAQVTLGLKFKPETIRVKARDNVVSATGINEDAPLPAKREYEQAMKLASKGQLRAAVESLKRAIDLHPGYLVAHNDLGAQYLKLGEVQEAAEQFRFVLEKDPKNFNSRFNLGLVLIDQDNFAGALSQFQMAVQVDSSRPVAHFWLGVAQLQMGDLQNAERELSRTIITGGGNFPLAHYYLGRLYIKRGDTSAAAKAYRAYLDEAPKGDYADEVRDWLKKQKIS